MKYACFFLTAAIAFSGLSSAGCASTASARAPAASASGSLDVNPDYAEFAQELNREAGLPEAAVLATLRKAKVQQSILDAMSRPAEAKPWKDYRPIFLTEKRIADGIAFYQANRELIERAADEFGVAPEIIVAIIGVETSYGRNYGSYKVLDALVTLAFHYPPRSRFFRGELRQLFLLGDTHMAYPIDELVGSYAGAMGWGQFIPTSVANFARDYDGDGRIDLWNSLPDIIGSVANYFSVHGWQKGLPVAVRATVASDARPISPEGLQPVYPVEQLKEWGYSSIEPVDPAQAATWLRLDGADGNEDWLTFQNFYVISRYNRSPLYSMAVWQLSQAIAGGLPRAAP
ncbi:MAG: lytic murein transglycosylase B [Dokdonella sp.]|uniref:lytic murein transglycosylase B n=1 Tax=Dokdonella sp. TaxID=2291710 RepID=UPI003BAFF7C1